MSPKQKKIAAKAPPPNKITGADFAVLKKEKAKGRGMGLQDESIKPGKVMKARDGKAIKKDPTKPVNPFQKTPKTTSKLPGRIGTALGIGAMMVPAAYAAAKQYKDYKSAKNRDKAKVKKYNKGGDLRLDYVYDQTKKNVRAQGKNSTTKKDMQETRREEYGAAKDRYPSKKDKLKGIAKRVGSLAPFMPTVSIAKGVYDKLSKSTVRKYSDGMSYKDMAPYGGKYAKKKNEMKADASENVKRLTTQPSAYDPEARYLVGSRRGRKSTTQTVRKTTDQVNLREAANKLKEEAGPGFNVSINTKSDLIRKRLIRPKRMAGRMGGGMMKRPMGYKSGTMVKARGCKLGRTRPTKIT